MLCVFALGLLKFSTICTAAAQEAEAAESEQDGTTKGFKGIFEGSKGDENAPLYVKSDNLRLDAKKRIFTYEGNVEITRGDLRITCDTMIGTYDENSQLQTVLCRDNVVITQGSDMRAIANRAKYTVRTAIIELTEAPELAREGNVLSADKITIYVDEDRSEAEGSVRVKVIKAEDELGGSAGGGLKNLDQIGEDDDSENES